MYLSPDTMEKYNAGYKRASVILAAHLPKSKPMSEILAEKAGTAAPEYEITPASEFKRYRWTELNRMINRGLIRQAKHPEKDFIQTGQADYKKACYARIFTNPKNGEIIAVLTGIK